MLKWESFISLECDKNKNNRKEHMRKRGRGHKEIAGHISGKPIFVIGISCLLIVSFFPYRSVSGGSDYCAGFSISYRLISYQFIQIQFLFFTSTNWISHL